MESLVLIIPLSLIGLAITVHVLFKALKSGQFEDLDKHGWSVVFDDRETPTENKKPKEPKEPHE